MDLLFYVNDDPIQDRGVFSEIILCGFAALAQLISSVGKPSTATFQNTEMRGQINHGTFTGNPAIVHDIEFRLGKWRGDLVLHNLGPHMTTSYRTGAILDHTDPAHINPHTGIELQSSATRCCLGAAEHNTNLLANLIGEQTSRLCLVNRCRQLPHRLAHEPGLGTHSGITHLPFQLGAGDQRRDRINHYDVDCITANQGFGDG